MRRRRRSRRSSPTARPRSPGCGPAARCSTDGRRARSPAPARAGTRAFRVVHAGGDATGAEVERALVAAAAGAGPAAAHRARRRRRAARPARRRRRPRRARRRRPSRRAARARGAAGHRRATGSSTRAPRNPATATGDGIALALRAGATAADLEFVQFHPTVLYTGPGRRPAAAGHRGGARRGRGAASTATGRRFMTGVHPLADLAPRDVVAAAITRRLAETGADCVYLDATASPDFAAPVPDRARRLPGRGRRPGARADPGDARPRTTPAAASSPTCDGRTAVPGPLRRGRGGPHRPARREPAGVQQPARGPGRRRAGGAGGGRRPGAGRAPAPARPARARRPRCRSRTARVVQRAMSAARRDRPRRRRARRGVGRRRGGDRPRVADATGPASRTRR